MEGRYDVAILDCPPSISLASESVFGAADFLLVPVIPTTLSSRTLHQLSEFLAGQESRPALLPYFSMVDGRKRLHREVMAELSATYPEILRTAIPAAADVERMGVARTVVEEVSARGRAAAAYRELWAEARSRLQA
jgi:cellulose biosynthesis protein BcsQ